MNTKLLIVEDDPVARKVLKSRCDERDDLSCMAAADGKTGISVAQSEAVDIVLLDFELPDMTAPDIIRVLKDNDPFVEIVVITAFGSIDRAVSAVKLGAFDFLTKPIEFDRLFMTIDKIIDRLGLSRRLSLLERGKDTAAFIGTRSKAARSMMESLQRSAETDSIVLLQGESGTGKEIAARLLHSLGTRSGMPFVKVDCTALQDTIVQSDLFGHEKGAFTGAVGLKRGRIELADRGTLFFDEIGELEQSMQAKLLRIIQDREFERVGGVKPLTVDVRVVAATNKDLHTMVETGRFREDLYYRLNVIAIVVPPLRERREDIPELTDYFFNMLGRELNRQIRDIPPRLHDLFREYDWPGNVRELKNIIERLVVFSENGSVRLDVVDRTLTGAASSSAEQQVRPLKEAVNDCKRTCILSALKRHDNSVAAAAEALGINRTYLYSLMDQLNIG